MPRLLLALVCGAALAVSGVVLQSALQNPLAEPTTLGTSSGAQLALSIAALWFPDIGEAVRVIIAAAGGAGATALTIAISWRDRLSASSVILCGLLTGLLCSALFSITALLDSEVMGSVFVWSAGSLAQSDWLGVGVAVCGALVAASGAMILQHPLSSFKLGDAQARSLGVKLATVRLLAICLAVVATGAVVSTVGLISFIGVAAPAFARLTGAHALRAELAWSAIIGALLLCATDQLVQSAGHLAAMIPAGTITGLLGAPLLLWLIPRLGALPEGEEVASVGLVNLRASHIAIFAVLLITACAISLGLARGPQGWVFDLGPDSWHFLQWRWPRFVAAASAGGMLAAAGSILQRMTRNRLASPEILGVSSGATLGVIFLTLLYGTAGDGERLIAAGTGATCVLCVLLIFSGKQHAFGQRLLLTGVSVTTIFTAVYALLIASGDPRIEMLSGWIDGSTYGATHLSALLSACVYLILLAILPFFARALLIAPLGDNFGRALGASTFSRQNALLLFAALLTAFGTLIVGPLSFVGLLAPQFSRLFGFRKAFSQLIGATGFGIIVMVFADWLGRNLLFPYELPAGVVCSAFGIPIMLLMFYLKKR